MSSQHEGRVGRYEFKYAVPCEMRDEIVSIAGENVQPDENAQPLGGPVAHLDALGYQVHSLYFDTRNLADYFERLSERRVRNRLRIRTYGERGDGAAVFLENKRKLDDLVVKHRVRICTAEEFHATAVPQPWAPWVDRLRGRKRYAGQHFRRLVDRSRRPVSVVHYHREVFVSRDRPESRIRLTMDHHVSASRPGDALDLYRPPEYPLLPPTWMVLELKFAHDRPGWMRQLCRLLQLTAEPVSKFGLSVALGLRDSPREKRRLTPPSIRSLGLRPSGDPRPPE